MLALRKLARGIGNLGLQELPEPEPAAGEVTIAVAYAGICGTDLHIHDDEFPSRPPVTLGHEVAGTIHALGEGVEAYALGERVTTETYYHTCGRCPQCRSGAPNMCLERRSIGSAVDGGFARLVRVPARNLHRIPPGLSLRDAALTEPLACVVHNALEVTRLDAGDLAVVSGPGPIGLLAAQVCLAAGATTVVLGTSADSRRLEAARAIGAQHVLDVSLDDGKAARELVAELGGRGADIVLECAGAQGSAALCLELVRPRGRYAQVGLFGRSISWAMDVACLKEVTVSGSNATVPSAWDRALRLLASGAVRAEPMISDVLPLEAWGEAFERVRRKDALKVLFAPGGLA